MWGQLGTMAEETPLTPAERIALVDSDRTRRNGQIGIALGLIIFAMAFLSIYAFFKADAAFLTYMATGVLSLVFAGIGAAFAIFGLGRTVGSSNTSNNDQILIMLQAINDLKKMQTPEETGEFYEDNHDDFDFDDDIPAEVPPGKETDSTMAAAIAPRKLQFLADRDTWSYETKTIDGAAVQLVAIQDSRRSKKKRTIYVYHIAGTNVIIYNRSRHGVYFMRIAYRPENVKQFFQIFVEEPLTEAEKKWLERNDYALV